MKKILVLFFSVCLSFFMVAGCSNTADVINYESDVPAGLTADEVKQCIQQAGLADNWVVTSTGDNTLEATYQARGHSATVQIIYNENTIKYNHLKSANLKYDGTKIHRNYNRWVNNLRDKTEKFMAARITANRR